jgi:hypothetical protein
MQQNSSIQTRIPMTVIYIAAAICPLAVLIGWAIVAYRQSREFKNKIK